MENIINNNTVTEIEEKKSHKLLAWVALVIALATFLYVGYHILYKGISFATNYLNGFENATPKEKLLGIIVALPVAILAGVVPIGRELCFALIVFFIILFAALLSIFAILSTRLAIRYLSKKTKSKVEFELLVVYTLISLFIVLTFIFKT